nr:Gfo/Idh/MocA family oxidoreductase [Oscillatoria laete-virens]
MRDTLHGRIGAVSMYDHASHGCIAQGGDPYGFGDTSWRVNGEFPLGPLFDGGIHEVALKQKLFGVPTAVTATGINYRPEHGEYDLINMLFEYGNGFTGLWTYSGFLGGRRNHFFIRGTEGLVNFEYHKFTIEKKDGTEEVIQDTPDAGAFFSGLTRAMYGEFLRCLETGAAPRYTAAESLLDIATLMAVRQSIHSGQKTQIASLL